MEYTDFTSKNIYKFEKKLIPISEKRNTAKITVEISRDKFERFYSVIEARPTNIPMEIIIYDEGKNNSLNYKVTLLYLLKTLNNLNISSIKFILSDSTLPIYTDYMSILGWKHYNKSEFDIKVLYNPISTITKTLAKKDLKEEELIWYSKEVLESLVKDIKEEILKNALNLQKIAMYFYQYLNETYYLEEMNEFDKVYLIYNQIRTHIRIPRQYVDIVDGIEVLKPNCNYPNDILEPFGTWDNKEGTYEGKARLMTIFLNNPYINIKATTIYGKNPQGKYTWVGVIINNKLYQCCTSIIGPFRNLEDFGYEIDNETLKKHVDIFNYEKSFLSEKEIKCIQYKIRKLGKQNSKRKQ